MGRITMAIIAVATLIACASSNKGAEAAARAECEAQGLPEGALLNQCIARMEEAVRIARENGGAPPQQRNSGQPR